MTIRKSLAWVLAFGAVLAVADGAEASGPEACRALAEFRGEGLTLEITRAEWVAPGPAEANPFGMGYPGELPQRCRVDGRIDRRVGASGKPYAIGFALALPEEWNGRFLFQGGGGLNGSVAQPLGATAAGDIPALVRGFAVASTDSGHEGAHPFDGAFFEDQEATLNFLYKAIGKVSTAASQIVEAFCGEPAAHSYYVGCSTGGREGMIMSQRFPDRFDGIVVGAPAMRTSFSNLADRWVLVTLNAVARRDDQGQPIPGTAFSEAQRQLIIDSLLEDCDARDGLRDEMIFDALGCDFDPLSLACSGGETEGCISEAQARALKKAFGGPVDSREHQVYPGFLYDTGIAASPPESLPGLLTATGGPVDGNSTATNMDVDAASVAAANEKAAVGDSTWTNLSTFSGGGGKLIFYHGVSDPWFSALDTLGYYERMVEANGGPAVVTDWSRLFLVPGMGHCGGGERALDRFDMLDAIVSWVEEDTAPESVIATGKAFPGRSRPLCPAPGHAHYRGQGDAAQAASFECRE